MSYFSKSLRVDRMDLGGLPVRVDEATQHRRSPWSKSDVALAIFAGQSNSGGTEAIVAADQIVTPLANVYVVAPKHNQSYDITDVVWWKYTSANGTLSRSVFGNMYNTAYYVAKKWQARIDAGEALPDLYIVHIAEGNQGTHFSLTNNKWAPERDRKLPDSYYHLMRHVLNLAVRNLTTSGKNVRVLGVDWNQWETDILGTAGSVATEIATEYTGSMNKVINGFSEALGCEVPWYFWRPRSRFWDETLFQIIAKQVDAMVASNPVRFSLIDVADHPDFRESAAAKAPQGVFQTVDGLHYLKKVFEWSADQVLRDWLVTGNRGIPIRAPCAPHELTLRQSEDLSGTVGVMRDALVSGGSAFFDRLFPAVPTPAFATSMFNRVSTYSGNAAQIVRSTDSVAANIPFAKYNSIDVDQVTTHLGNGAGQVLWYDQVSGNKVAKVGSVGPLWGAGSSGRGDVAFSSGTNLAISPVLSLGTAHTLMVVTTKATLGVAKSWLNGVELFEGLQYTGYNYTGSGFTESQTAGNAPRPFGYVVMGLKEPVTDKAFSWSFDATEVMVNPGFTCVMFRRNGAVGEAFVNGVSMGTLAVPNLATKAFTLTGICGNGSASNFLPYHFTGSMPEVVCWSQYLSNAQVQSVTNSVKLLYT
jgi:hypothetical protein